MPDLSPSANMGTLALLGTTVAALVAGLNKLLDAVLPPRKVLLAAPQSVQLAKLHDAHLNPEAHRADGRLRWWGEAEEIAAQTVAITKQTEVMVDLSTDIRNLLKQLSSDRASSDS